MGRSDDMKPTILRIARDDLKEINEILSEYGKTPTRRFRESFETFCKNVEHMPYMYSQYEYHTKYRRAVIAYDYLVFYQVDDLTNKVTIYRVLHGKRNVETFLEVQ